MRIEINLKPIAKTRPRFARRGKYVMSYNDQKTDEGLFLFELRRCIGETKKFTEPLRLTLEFYLPRPKSHYGTGKNAGKVKKSAPYYHTQTPDIDNLCKFIMDCLNGYLWLDDKQVFDLSAYKFWCDPGKERTEIKLFEES